MTRSFRPTPRHRLQPEAIPGKPVRPAVPPLLPQIWNDVRWRSIALLLLGTWAATPIGIHALANLPATPIRMALAIVVFVAASKHARDTAGAFDALVRAVVELGAAPSWSRLTPLKGPQSVARALGQGVLRGRRPRGTNRAHSGDATHHRQPAIIKPHDFDTPVEQALKTARAPLPDGRLTWWPVSLQVNSPRKLLSGPASPDGRDVSARPVRGTHYSP